MTDPQDDLPPDIKELKDSVKVGDPGKRLKKVKADLSQLTSTPEGSDLLLRAIASIDVSQEMSSELVRELVLKLNSRSIRQLAAEGTFPQQSLRERLCVVAVGAFAFVLIGSCIALAVSTFYQEVNTSASQMLLTMFTTSVGFLSGFFVTGPGNSSPSQPTVSSGRRIPVREMPLEEESE